MYKPHSNDHNMRTAVATTLVDRPLSLIATKPTPARVRLIRAENDNGGRRVVLRLQTLWNITSAEIDVFGSFLGEAEIANDDSPVARNL